MEHYGLTHVKVVYSLLLMVNYWQTNGGDGLAHVSETVPTNPPVIGSTWFDTVNEVLYVYVGVDADGNGLWQIVKGAGEITLTTATLPLAMARSTFSLYTPTIIPDVPIDQMGVQKDFNDIHICRISSS